MKAKEFHELLVSIDACPEAVRWCKGKSLAVAWRTSKRADWMLWLCGEMAGKPGWPTRKEVVFAACACARTALRYLPKGEKRPLVAIETAERWTRGKATIEEVMAAAVAAWAARDAAWAAGDAAWAARDAAWAAGDAAWAAGAAAWAAGAAAVAARAAWAARAAGAAAECKALSDMATLVRKHLEVPRGR